MLEAMSGILAYIRNGRLDILAPSWGSRATEDGKDVWFTLAL